MSDLTDNLNSLTVALPDAKQVKNLAKVSNFVANPLIAATLTRKINTLKKKLFLKYINLDMEEQTKGYIK
jgi:hypothetical protein